MRKLCLLSYSLLPARDFSLCFRLFALHQLPLMLSSSHFGFIIMRKYFITTYGCQMNVSDSERVAAVLEGLNFTPAKEEGDADVLIYNTCSVRQKSENRILGSRDKWQEMKRKNPNMVIAITGCMVAHKGYNFRHKLPEVDITFDIHELPTLPGKLAKAMGVDLKKSEYQDYLNIVPKIKSHFQVFVPIMTGCNNFCSFCIVPFTRGRERSRPVVEILAEIKKFVSEGAKEVTLLGQNVNSFRGVKEDGKQAKFSYLLREVAKIQGIERIFYTSPHPKDMKEDMLLAHAEIPQLCPTVHLPVQSGSSAVLKRMNRFYTKESYLELVAQFQAAVPDITITTDIIVGFCGETEEEFADTMDLYRKAQFDLVYLGMYSPRPHSLAYKMQDDVPASVKKERFHRLHALQEEIAEEKNKQYLEQVVSVLVDKIKAGIASGKSQHFKYVELPAADIHVGDIVSVKINETLTWVLRGEKV